MAKLIKYSMTAVVPVAQYANLQPTVEVEAETLKEAEDMVLPYIENFFNAYFQKDKIGKKPVVNTVSSSPSTSRVLIKDIFGNEIYYDDSKHEYTNEKGEVYLSGSVYADEEKFDEERWSKEFVDIYGLDKIDAQRIKDMWSVNKNVSTSFGTALHAAIELYGKYHKLANVIDMNVTTGERKKLDAKTTKNSALSKLPYFKDAVNKFFTEERLKEKALYEVFVVDHKNKRAGQIDRLIIHENGEYSVRDVKTNYKILKKERTGYGKQLSFYADIIVANGGRLSDEPVGLHHWTDGEWKDIPLEKVNTI